MFDIDIIFSTVRHNALLLILSSFCAFFLASFTQECGLLPRVGWVLDNASGSDALLESMCVLL